MHVDPAELSILTYPASALRRVAETVEEIDEGVRVVANRMIELTREARGVGLAAPQVGVSWRLFVTVGPEDEPARVYVNPHLSEFIQVPVVREEGCLSLPGINVDIRRPAGCMITAMDLDGREFTLTRDDLLARVWQHETDHLNAILIIDKMSVLDRLANRKLIKELEAAAVPWAEG